jgi:hypothetical protein
MEGVETEGNTTDFSGKRTAMGGCRHVSVVTRDDIYGEAMVSWWQFVVLFARWVI